MISFRPTKENEEFLNKFENKTELINYLLAKAKNEYEKSKKFFDGGLSTIAASNLENKAELAGVTCRGEFDFDLKSPVDRRILKEAEE